MESALALVYGTNITTGTGLVYMPPVNWRSSLAYGLPFGVVLSGSVLVVAQQDHIDEEQDFLPPPPGYALLGGGLSREFTFGTRVLSVQLEAENLLNQRYRDYLDRQRYFADAPGRSINFRIGYSW